MIVAVASHLFPTRALPLRGLFVRSQVEAVAATHDCAVLSPQYPWGGLEAPEGLDVSVTYRALPWRKSVPSQVNVVVAERAYERLLAPFLAETMPGVVHAHYGFPDGFAAVRVSRRLGLPCVVTLHGSDANIQLRRPGSGWAVARTLAEADRVVCVSPVMLEELARDFPHLATRAECVPNGFDDDDIRFVPDSVPEYLLFVGGLVPVKNVDVLLRAYAAVKDRLRVPLLIAGDGPLREGLCGLAERLGVAEDVRFLGGVAHEDVGRLYQRAIALVLPSSSEGMPVVAIEALASGTPVVASAVGALPTMIREGVLGLLVPPGDEGALGEGLVRAIEHEWDRPTIARSCGALTWVQVAERLGRLYEATVAERRTRA